MVWLVYTLALFPQALALLFYRQVKVFVKVYTESRVLMMQMTQVYYASFIIADLSSSCSKKYMMLFCIRVLAHPTPVLPHVEQRWLLSH
jgi:hypothetical protein